MSKKQRKGAAAPSVVVCHGCCCARTPERDRCPDAVGRMERLRERLRPRGIAVAVVDCLGPCERKDVVVVRPSGEGRAQGARPHWCEGMNEEQLFDRVAEWVEAGGPGVEAAPDELFWRAFTPQRRHRQACEDVVA